MTPSKLTKDTLQQLKTLERESYNNSELLMMQSSNTWEEIADYCECELSELKVYMTDEWYILLAEHEDYIEFVDLASKTKATPLFKVLSIVEQFDKPFIMDCRESTSYRIIKSMERAGRIRIEKDEPYQRDGECFHDIECQIVLNRGLNYKAHL